jgi:hypothetical protein
VIEHGQKARGMAKVLVESRYQARSRFMSSPSVGADRTSNLVKIGNERDEIAAGHDIE